MAHVNTFFTATTGRTGTQSLVELFQLNLPDCKAEHEPACYPRYFGWLHRRLFPTRLDKLTRRGFGHALEWYDQDSPRLMRLVRCRAGRIRRLGCRVYLESSHAFLSSLGESYLREFPDLGLIHLTRTPLEVAVSYCHRNRIPTDDSRFLRVFSHWHPHPDSRQNCLRPPPARLNCLQYYLWAWIEAELRFLCFVEKYPSVRHFALDTAELNEVNRITDMFRFFGLETRSAVPELPPVRNRNRERTLVTEAVRETAHDLLRRLDIEVLERLPRPYDLLELRAG